jgi:hypothetical protein
MTIKQMAINFISRDDVEVLRVDQSGLSDFRPLEMTIKARVIWTNAPVSDFDANVTSKPATRGAEMTQWAVDTFGPVALNKSERLMRFVEEAIETAHAGLLPVIVLDRIIDRVYSYENIPMPGREAFAKELAQAMLTLECLAHVHGIDVNAEVDKEVARLKASDPEERRARHRKKVELGIAIKGE